MTVDRSEFTPSKAFINNITNEQKAVVTFTDTHPYVLDEIISFRVSKPYGMVEMNNLSSKVIEVAPTSVRVEIDTTNFSPFVYPPIGEVQFIAMAVPSASGIRQDLYNAAVILDACFDNVPLT